MRKGYLYRVKVCPTTFDRPGTVRGKPSVEGLTIRVCPCAVLVPPAYGGCIEYYPCREQITIQVCPEGVDCADLQASVSWEVKAVFSGDYVVGWVSWTNPSAGCSLKEVQLWAMIPRPGEQCNPPFGGYTCVARPLFLRRLSESFCDDGGGQCCMTTWTGGTDCPSFPCYDDDCPSTNLPRPPCCRLLPESTPGGSVRCATDGTSEHCAGGEGISGIAEKVRVRLRFPPGSSFWVFGNVAGRGWRALGHALYESTGVVEGAFKQVTNPATGAATVDKGNLGSTITTKLCDYTSYSFNDPTVDLKLDCYNDGPPPDDEYTSEDVCDKTGANYFVVPIEPEQTITNLQA